MREYVTMRSTMAAPAMCLVLILLVAPSTETQVSEPADPRITAIRALLVTGEYDRAEREAADLRTALARDSSPSASDVQQATDLLVEARCRNGKAADAATRELADGVLRDRSARVGPDDLSIIPSLRNLADVLLQSGQFRSAVEASRRAVAIRERLGAPASAELAQDLDQLAQTLLWAESWDEALAVAGRAVGMKEQAYAADAPQIARSLVVQGEILQRKGKHALARGALERAVAIQEAAGASPPELADALSLHGEELWFNGEPVQAKQQCERALALAEGSLRSGHPTIAVHLRRLALPVYDLGDSARAQEIRERALSIAQTVFGPDHPAVGLQLNDLANSFTLQADYFAARSLFEKALRIFEKLGPDSAGATAVAYNLAVVSSRLGDYIEAERYYKQVIGTWTRLHGPDNQYVAYGLFALGDLREMQGLPDEARGLYERTLGLREKAAGPNSLDVARTLTSLSRTLLELGLTAEAYARVTRSVEIWADSGATESGDFADALRVRAKIQVRLGDPASVQQAQESYREAIEILARVFGPRHREVASANLSLSVALALDGNPTQAIATAFEAEAIDRESVRFTLRYLGERQALAYASGRHEALNIALSLSEQRPEYATELLDRVIRARSVTLDEMAARHHAAEAAVPGVVDLRMALNSARQRLANLVVRGPVTQSPEQYLALIDSVKRDKDRAERALADRSYVFRSDVDRPEVDLDSVRRSLPRRSALLSIYRYDRIAFPAKGNPPSESESAAIATPRMPEAKPFYVAFVLRAGADSPVIVPLGYAETIDAQVARWRRSTTTGFLGGSPASSEGRLRQVGLALRRLVWDPVSPHVGDAERVYVVPDGSVNLIPLTALPIGQTSYLLEQGPTIHYLSTERDLVVPRNLSAVGSGLLALGAPLFEDPSPFVALEKGSSAGTNRVNDLFRGAVSKCPSFQTMQFGVLPGTGKEANYIAGLWKEFGPARASVGPKVLLGSAADERSFKQLSPGHRVLHLATHGFFLGSECASALDGTRSVGGLVDRKNPQAANQKRPIAKAQSTLQPGSATGENPLLLSGLAMAGANRRAAATTDEDDGILTAEEVASLNLSGVEWAVLSACDTGLGEIKVGEGVFGLRRAFQIAGAHTVIMSLWSVEDRAAMTWMRALYEGRLAKKLDTAAAVREASLTVLRQRRARGQSTHPFYWAGFVASGDWR